MAHAERSEDAADNPRRRERAAIAAQACQTCRTRKSKCDEKRPKCSLCERLGLDCEYREPLPTKKDKTMVQILEALSRLETKFDNLQPQHRAFAAPPSEALSTRASSTPLGILPSIPGPSSPLPGGDRFATMHRILVWPSIYIHLANLNVPAISDLQYLVEHGTPWLLEQAAKHSQPLDAVASLQASPAPGSRDSKGSGRVTFSDLSIQQIQSYNEAYFHTFNVLFPLLDAEAFTNNIVSPLLATGYGYGDSRSVLALLVFALGQLALSGTLDQPAGQTEIGHQSGLRGGSITNPPGLEMFNEARRRLGFISSEHSVEAVQCHLLAAIYYSSNAMHVEAWQSSGAASIACQILLRNGRVDWLSADTEPLKRAYWVCFLHESVFRSELCLPGSLLQHLQTVVPLPSSNAEHTPGSPWVSDVARPHHEHYFNALCSLERLMAEIHTTILEPMIEQSGTKMPFHGPPMSLVRDMARQLDSWRFLLPRQLQWLDQEMYRFPDGDHTARAPTDALFMVDQGAVPIRHRYNLDIATAWLRSRFYYARALIYQPFIYKALHFPELLTKEDADCAAMGIRALCGWPICMAPPKDKKRLVPFLSSWTQIFISVLLILEIARVHAPLKNICEEQVNSQQVQRTVLLLLEWVDDARQIDGIAAWSWPILRPLFKA